MEALQFWLASFSPVLLLAAVWIAGRRFRYRWIIAATVAALVIGLPVGVGLVGIALHLHTERGVEHSPGVGVAFIPLLMIWSLCCLAAVVRLLFAGVAKVLQRNQQT